MDDPLDVDYPNATFREVLDISGRDDATVVGYWFDLHQWRSYDKGKMVAETRITSKGQIVIPKPIRDELDWRPGTRLHIRTEPNGEIRLAVIDPDESDDPIERAFGFLKEGDPLSDLEHEHRLEVEADERRRRGR